MISYERPKGPQEEAREMYDSLPESMKTGHFTIASEEPYFPTLEEARAHADMTEPDRLIEAYPSVLVTFKDGRKLELNLNAEMPKKGTLDDLYHYFHQQIEAVQNAAARVPHVASAVGIWRP